MGVDTSVGTTMYTILAGYTHFELLLNGVLREPRQCMRKSLELSITFIIIWALKLKLQLNIIIIVTKNRMF